MLRIPVGCSKIRSDRYTPTKYMGSRFPGKQLVHSKMDRRMAHLQVMTSNTAQGIFEDYLALPVLGKEKK